MQQVVFQGKLDLLVRSRRLEQLEQLKLLEPSLRLLSPFSCEGRMINQIGRNALGAICSAIYSGFFMVTFLLNCFGTSGEQKSCLRYYHTKNQIKFI